MGAYGGSSLPQQDVPEAIKTNYRCPWWTLTVLLLLTTIGCFIALNVFGGLVMLMLTFWSYYMVKNSCREMSQYCMFSFGLMTLMQAVFELIPLCMSVGGRRKEHTVIGGSNQGMHGGTYGTETRTYTTTIEITPFFDKSQGWHYNFQSAMMIASFSVMLIAALLAHLTYRSYPTSLFEDNDTENQTFGGARGGGDYRYGGAGGGQSYGGGGGGGGRAVGRQQQQQQPQRSVFGGEGRTLGR